MSIDLAAIRARDVAAERCARCGYSRAGHRDDSLAACNRALARSARRQGKPARTCGDPDAHHKFQPGGGVTGWTDGEAEQDRRDLLAYIDTLAREQK